MILMKCTCSVSGIEFEISDFEKEFLQKIAPTFAGKKFEIPFPDRSPVERARQRTAHRNEQFLFRNKDFFTGKPIVSVYRPGSGRKICSRDDWFGDRWDALNFGREFDFSKKFFDQFHALQLDVPYAATVTCQNENSEFTTGTGFCKNCYLINSSEYCHDCLYGKLLQKCTNVLDTAFAYNSELLYECFDVEKCYDCKWTYYSQGCHDCWFCDDCRGCHHCFLCTNLVKKEYHFLNQKLSKKEYERRVSDFLVNHKNIEKAKDLFDDLRSKRIYKFANTVNCENCTGDFLSNSKNCQECFDVNGSEDCHFVQLGVEAKDLLDCSNMYIKPQLSYQTLGVIETFNCHFCLYVFHSSDLWYCEQCFNCKNCFGCVGLRNKQYCILNRQFKKNEYEAEVAKIISAMQETGEWGQFFPVEISPFPYNDTVAHGYFPLSQSEVSTRGWKWGADVDRQTKPQTFEIPEKIADVREDILKEILACDQCKKNYKLQKMELNFYRDMQLPVPRICPDCRYESRMKLRNPRQLFDRNCQDCGVEVRTPFAPDRPEKIFCEECYLAVVN